MDLESASESVARPMDGSTNATSYAEHNPGALTLTLKHLTLTFSQNPTLLGFDSQRPPFLKNRYVTLTLPPTLTLTLPPTMRLEKRSS